MQNQNQPAAHTCGLIFNLHQYHHSCRLKIMMTLNNFLSLINYWVYSKKLFLRFKLFEIKLQDFTVFPDKKIMYFKQTQIISENIFFV